MMKKVILKLDLHDNKEKQKAMKAVCSLSGIDSVAMDMKEKKLTVIGDVDPIDVVKKLCPDDMVYKLRELCPLDVVNKSRKAWHTEILSVGPAKEAEKKKEETKKEEPQKLMSANPPQMLTYYHVVNSEYNPNPCVIC